MGRYKHIELIIREGHDLGLRGDMLAGWLLAYTRQLLGEIDSHWIEIGRNLIKIFYQEHPDLLSSYDETAHTCEEK